MAEVKRGSSFREKAAVAAWGMVCLILFIYIRFPYDTFRGRLEQSIGQALNQPVTLGHIHSRFPLGVKVDGVSIKGVPFSKELDLSPRIFSLLTGKMGMSVKAVLPTGSISYSFESPMGKSARSVQTSVKMDNFDSSLLKTLFASGIGTKGTITGDIDLAGPSPSLRDMGGRISFTWRDGYIPVPDSQMPIDSLQFKTMELESHMDRGIMTLDRLELKGNISGNVKGSVRMADTFRRSRLNLTGEMTLPSSAALPAGTAPGISPQGPLRFSLRGTIERPRFRILGSAM